MKETEIYYTNGFDVYGPISMDDFCKNRYYKSTKIWYAGLDGWLNISDSDVLKHCVGTTASSDNLVEPPIAPLNVAPPLTKMHSPTEPVKDPVEEKKDTAINKYIVALLIVAVIVSVIISISTRNKKNKVAQVMEDPIVAMVDSTAINDSLQAEKKGIAEDAIQLGIQKTHRQNWDKFFVVEPSFKKKELGGIDKISIQMGNKTPFVLNYAKVKIDYLKANGEVFQTENLEFHNVARDSFKTLFAPDSKRGVDVTCTLLEAKSTGMNFCYKWDKVSNSVDPYLCK